MKGKVKVELFEGDTLIQTEEKHNLISKLPDFAYKYLARNLWTQDKAVGGTTIEVGDMLARMLLTDYTGVEDKDNEWCMQGDTIGWATTTERYSGNSTTQGTINTTESFTDRSQIHLVYDFPTDAGNGTFQSIYHHPNGNLISNHGYFNRFRSCDSFQEFDGDYYALVTKNKKNKIYKIDSNYEIVDDWTFPSSIVYLYDFYIKDQYIYYIDRYGKCVLKASLTNPANTTKVKNKPTENFPYGIAYSTNTNKWVVTEDNSGSSSILDDGFNIIDTFPKRSKRLFSHNGDIYDENGAIFDFTDKEFKTGVLSGVAGVFDDNYLVNTSGRLMPKYQFTSRALLDNPVTKTNQTTMKVTYDFMLPDIFQGH